MTERFFIDLVIVLLLAILGGLIARGVRQPPILGYMAAGVLLQTGVLGYRIDLRNIHAIAELGVALLLFAVGVEFSLRGLLQVRRIALYGGILQVGLTALLVGSTALLIGWTWYPSLFLGGVAAMSSTMLVMKLLGEEGQLHSRHGTVMLGLLIFQDLAAVALMALLPALHGLTIATLPVLALSLLKAIAFLAAALGLAFGLVPQVLRLVAGARSKELLILTAVGICFTAAVGSYSLGFSVALGAFIAGLIISESEYSHEILAEILPIRDLFASLFFVAIGMLFQPTFLLRAWEQVLLFTLMIVVGKAVITGGTVWVFGWHPRIAVTAGLGLTQIGEFSFVLTKMGLDRGLVDSDLYSLVISMALITMFLTPMLLRLAARIAHRLPARPLEAAAAATSELQGHVLLCGCGRVGRQVTQALERFRIPFVVIDYDRWTVRRLSEEGIPVVYGDASREEILQPARADTAASAVVAIPDDVVAALVIRRLHQLNPELPVVARGHSDQAVRFLEVEGADEVVSPEFEAGLEMVRHALLHHHRIEREAIESYLAEQREQRYHPHQHPDETSLPVS